MLFGKIVWMDIIMRKFYDNRHLFLMDIFVARKEKDFAPPSASLY